MNALRTLRQSIGTLLLWLGLRVLGIRMTGAPATTPSAIYRYSGSGWNPVWTGKARAQNHHKRLAR